MAPENRTRIPAIGNGPLNPFVSANKAKLTSPSTSTFTRRWFLILRFMIVVIELRMFQMMQKIRTPASHQLKVRVTPNAQAKDNNVNQRSDMANQSYRNG